MKESRNQDQSDLHQPVFFDDIWIALLENTRTFSVGPPSVSAPPSMISILGDPISAGVSALHLSYRMILCLPVCRLLRLECQFFDDLMLNGVPAPLSGNPIFHDPIPDSVLATSSTIPDDRTFTSLLCWLLCLEIQFSMILSLVGCWLLHLQYLMTLSLLECRLFHLR